MINWETEESKYKINQLFHGLKSDYICSLDTQVKIPDIIVNSKSETFRIVHWPSDEPLDEEICVLDKHGFNLASIDVYGYVLRSGWNSSPLSTEAENLIKQVSGLIKGMNQ